MMITDSHCCDDEAEKLLIADPKSLSRISYFYFVASQAMRKRNFSGVRVNLLF